MTVAELSGLLDELKEKGVQNIGVIENSHKGPIPCVLEAFCRYAKGDDEFIALNVKRLEVPGTVVTIDGAIKTVEESCNDYALNENVKAILGDDDPAFFMEYEISKVKLCIFYFVTLDSLNKTWSTDKGTLWDMWMQDGSPVLDYMQSAKEIKK